MRGVAEYFRGQDRFGTVAPGSGGVRLLGDAQALREEGYRVILVTGNPPTVAAPISDR
jgi:hypothetical protein